ncbi:Leucine Rich repeats (2 copies) [Planctomycetes bacterium Pan216]|uniref:Leucine Rich repeats (2 copies) n=1 Tax=Kolteria novifilia TaxID=2527975 RepID=A0A518BAM8_9BACT|nr:Leucine Rich repeats (2 copies) [Planctomycetes bacterium Pan216]
MSEKDDAEELMRILKEHRVLLFPKDPVRIELLSLRDDCITEEVFSRLHALPRLKRVSLSGSHITDAGLEYLADECQLEELNLRSCKEITDEGMRHLATMTSLRRLDLSDTNIGDVGLEHLTSLGDLEKLDLHSTRITDAGLAKITSLSKLKHLDVGGPGVTDACLEHVGQVTSLEWLILCESTFTDAGLAKLGELVSLRYLSIAWTEMTGVGFKTLSKLKKLKSLLATDTRFGDEGLRYLAACQGLGDLGLSGTRVTDKGLVHLQELKHLKSLGLGGTRVTQEGKMALKGALPRCVITITEGQEEVDLSQFDEEYYWTHPPHCIAGFNAKALRRKRLVTFQLACSCGSGTGQVLGYPLSKYNEDYEGDMFVGPLGFQCSACQKTTEIIDTEKHGWNGELGCSCTSRGTGPRVGFRCPDCGSQEMSVVVWFSNDGNELEMVEDDPTIAPEDFFGWFTATGICASCQAEHTIADFECA